MLLLRIDHRQGLGISWRFTLSMPSNNKMKSGKGKGLASVIEKLGTVVKKGRFSTLVTYSPTLSPAKGWVEQDWDLEGLKDCNS